MAQALRNSWPQPGTERIACHSFYEIYFFLKGNGSILFEGSQLDFKSPSVLFLPPSRPRQWKVPATPDCRMVIFEGEFMETFLKDHLFLHRLYYFGNADSLPILPLQSKNVPLFQHLTDSIKGEISRQSFDSQHLLRAYRSRCFFDDSSTIL
ncbi:AraC family ligand binding domain-containing protein [Chitinophaga sp. Ak27]|uniref:AraC family ligand binding domain-containing protein n=1 Tax=Chitinophaga sp. Ak27 TaxID=2726116 RepID=UPI00145E1B14|nr:AraC family ligand binding domain-containing protein [Chitinophaga sp. Ak27]NLU91966.1 hypothetical protein [Chitinophaga sp. Ak27]